MSKSLKDDNAGSESLMPTLVSVVSFVCIGVLLLTQSTALTHMGQQSQADYSVPNTNFPANNYQAAAVPWDPQGVDMYGNVSFGHFDYRDSANMTFYYNATNQHHIKMWIVRDYLGYDPNDTNPGRYDHYSDFIYVYQAFGLFNWKIREAWIPWELIAANVDYTTDGNWSIVPISLQHHYEVYFASAPGTNFTTMLWQNRLNVSLAWVWNESDYSNVSPWDLVGQILTFHIPEVDWWLTAMIAVPIYIAIGFMILTIIGRFIPLVSGG